MSTWSFNGNKVNLPKLVSVKLQDKCKIRHMMKREPLLFHIMLKQGITVKMSTEESGRTFAERFREHMKSPSPTHDHCNTTGHKVSLNNFTIVGREDQSMARTIKEAMLIRVNDPSLNRNIGKYQLPHIWDEVLVKSPEIKTKVK